MWRRRAEPWPLLPTDHPEPLLAGSSLLRPAIGRREPPRRSPRHGRHRAEPGPRLARCASTPTFSALHIVQLQRSQCQGEAGGTGARHRRPAARRCSLAGAEGGAGDWCAHPGVPHFLAQAHREARQRRSANRRRHRHPRAQRDQGQGRALVHACDRATRRPLQRSPRCPREGEGEGEGESSLSFLSFCTGGHSRNSYFRHPSAARGCTRGQKIGQRARSARGPIFLPESAPEGCTGVADVCLLPDSALFEALGTFFVEIFF